MAIDARQPQPGTLVHGSDRGVRRAGCEYSGILHAHGVRASMSRVANLYDKAES